MATKPRPKNFEDLIHACHEHGAYKTSAEKLEDDDLLRAKFSREDAERETKARDKRSAEEISSADESEPTSFKERKRVSLRQTRPCLQQMTTHIRHKSKVTPEGTRQVGGLQRGSKSKWRRCVCPPLSACVSCGGTGLQGMVVVIVILKGITG